MGLELEQPPVGCCAQAGSFGYEPAHYDVSMKIAEDVLLPAVRKAPEETLLIAGGFSCREQIRHGAGRWAMHPAEVLALALDTRGTIPAEVTAERCLEPAARSDLRQAVLAGSALAAVGAAAWAARRMRA